jgi:hypothetical protein
MRHVLTLVAVAMSLVTLLLPPSFGQPCQPTWTAEFPNDAPDVDVRAMALFNDGTGAAVYAGGIFHVAGRAVASSVARLAGDSWSALGDGVNGTVDAFAVFDDGDGSALYVGGSFTTAGGIAAADIARWDGVSWSPLGEGVNGALDGGGVHAMTVFDDGGGPALYVTGHFSAAGGLSASGIARWDGHAWSSLGAGLQSSSDTQIGGWAMAVLSGGPGPALYVGGYFNSAGGVPAANIARWNGSSWSPLGAGVPGQLRALLADPAADPPLLYVGGAFWTINDVPAGSIARWDGATWSPVGDQLLHPPYPGQVSSLAFFGAGPDRTLYAGGVFAASANRQDIRNLAQLQGDRWQPAGAGMNGPVEALLATDEGHGPSLLAGGNFTASGPVAMSRIARWEGSEWRPVAQEMGFSGAPNRNARVLCLARIAGEESPIVVAGGSFTSAGGRPALNVAAWDGQNWSPLGEGLAGAEPQSQWVNALATFDDGQGPFLYAGGSFGHSGANEVSGIARWTGSEWVSLGSGLVALPGYGAPEVKALKVMDNAAGRFLYVGGSFSAAGGVPANNIARWDGAAWSCVGAGLDGYVRSLEVFDDGSGPALYASGTIPGEIAKWTGQIWQIVGGGLATDSSGGAGSMFVSDVGGHAALYLGTGGVGDIYTAGGVQINAGIARWDGSTWSGVVDPSGCDPVVGCVWPYAFAQFDDGSGPALYAAGSFGYGGRYSSSPGMVARWDGAQWARLGTGLSGEAYALAAIDDPAGSSLVVGGGFQIAAGHSSECIARWLACPRTCPADWNHSGSLNSQDLFDFLSDFFAGHADFNGDAATTSADFFAFLAAFLNGC